MEITWVVVGIVVFIYFYYWYRRPDRSPPGPRGIPGLGVIPFLGKYPERKLKQWSKSYGPIMSVRMGTKDQIFLNSYDTIIQGWVKQPAVFNGRPENAFLHQVIRGQGVGFIDYGDKWKSQRKFGLMTLRGFGVGKRSMESRIIEELDALNDSIRSHDEKPFDVVFTLKNAISNNICSVVMGRRFDYDDPRFQQIMHGLFEFFPDPISNRVFRILMLAPPMRHLPFFSFYNRRILNNIKDIENLLGEIIKEHEDTFDGEELRDFIDAFIKEKKNEQPYFTNLQLIHFVRDLFIAGTETASSTLNWSLLCCLHYQQAQSKLREEILKVFGPDGAISMSRKNEMPYTNAFIQEVFRYRTLAVLGLPHKINEDAEICGYFVEKGTTMFANLWGVHNDPELWDEPEKFKPERFLDEKGNYVPTNHVIPFSVGPRHCLGEQLARMEIFIFLVGMIQKFEFLPDPSADQLPDIDKGSNGQAFVPLPYKILAKQM